MKCIRPFHHSHSPNDVYDMQCCVSQFDPNVLFHSKNDRKSGSEKQASFQKAFLRVDIFLEKRQGFYAGRMQTE